jgi:phosphatidylinositol alpha-mannosyltransferase
VTRVALMNPVYWPEVARGSERIIHDLAVGLIADGHEAELLTSTRGEPRRGTVDGLPVVYNRRPPDRWLLDRGFDDFWTHTPFAYRSLVKGGYDVAHSFYPTDTLAAAAWSRRSGRPTVQSVMGVPNPLIKVRFDAQPRAARAADVTTVLSKAVRDAFFWRWGIETRVLYPGVDTEAFAPGERDERPTIFCPAAIGVARKRVSWLVDALSAVRRQVPDVRLLLMKPSDPQAAAELTQAGADLFDPVTTAEELAPLYRSAWVTALPSWGEAFGIVLIESLACGTPVVGTARDAFPEIVDSDAVGRLFDDSADDPLADLASALVEAIELARDPATTRACRDRAAGFSLARNVAHVEAIYAELLGS